MKRSLEILFEGEKGASLNFGGEVRDFRTQIQRALVNLATERGSDAFSTERGTTLFADALRGRITDDEDGSSANFAAVDTWFFLRETDPADEIHRTAQIRLAVVDITVNRLSLRCSMDSTQGETVGILSDL